MKVLCRLPDVTIRVTNDGKLMGVVRLPDLGARWRSVWVISGRGTRRGRLIFLVIRTCLFLWSERARSSVGRRGTWTTRSQIGRRGYQLGRRRRGSNVVRGRCVTRCRRRRAFLLARDEGIVRVRAVAEGRCDEGSAIDGGRKD